jgi:hypothetical protein
LVRLAREFHSMLVLCILQCDVSAVYILAAIGGPSTIVQIGDFSPFILPAPSLKKLLKR